MFNPSLYRDLERVAAGAYGIVYKTKVIHKEDTDIAVKLMPAPKSIHDRYCLSLLNQAINYGIHFLVNILREKKQSRKVHWKSGAPVSIDPKKGNQIYYFLLSLIYTKLTLIQMRAA
jgi:hypothetical protein